MKIRTYYIASSLALGLVLAVIGVIGVKSLDVHYALVQSESHRFNSYLLAFELFQSSEDMTRMARKYVATGREEFEKYYYEILDIRNGVSPRPEEYTATYWHLSGVGKGPAIKMGKPESLQNLMKKEGITEDELALLQESQANSDHLTLIEKRAFAAMKGLYDDGSGSFTVKGAPNKTFAINLLYSDEYSDEKAGIMAPIQQFMDTLEARTEAELHAHETMLYGYIVWELAFLFISMIVVATGIFYSFRMILRPLARLEGQVKEIDSGNYAARILFGVRSGKEIVNLCASFNTMADSLQKDIQRRQNAAAILEKSEERVRLLLDSAGEAMYGINLEGECTFANPACARILGFEGPEALIGKNMHLLIHHSYPDGRPMPVEECNIFKAFRTNEQTHADDEVFWKADGTSFVSEYRSHPLFADGRVYGAVVTFSDITERRRAEEALAADRQRLANVLQGTNIGAWESDIQNRAVVLSPRMAEIMGYSLRELSPFTPELRSKFIHPDDFRISTELMEKHFRKESELYECELRVRHKDGRWIWALERGRVTKWDAAGRPLLISGTLEDITERKEQMEKILHMATHDALTDLPNLRLAKDRLSMALRRARRSGLSVAAMFVDLDGFKKVNDSHGHDAGNTVLKEVGERLRAGVRDVDTVARIGGDEFLLVVTELTAQNASEVARKLLTDVSRPIRLPRVHTSIGASIGVALFPGCADKVDALIAAADEAMYKVKHSGKNGFSIAPLASTRDG